jgi:tRNA-2-methylthio-N6-dimethylallyladenosine synthase
MTDHIVVFEGNERLIGRTVPVRVEEASAFTLFGTVVTGEQIGVADTQPEIRDLVPPRQEESRNRLELPLV